MNASAIISNYLKDMVGVLERMPVKDIERVISVIADARHHRNRCFSSATEVLRQRRLISCVTCQKAPSAKINAG